MARRFQERKKTEPEEGRRQGVKGSVVLFYLVSASLMFVLGVHVGRGTLPFKYDIPNIELSLQEVLTGLEKETIEKKNALEFYNELKDGEKTDSRPPLKTILARSTEKKRLSDYEEDPPASSAVPEKTPSAPVKRESPERAAPGAGPPENWTVQVAAFSSPEEAALRVKKFREKGYDAYVVEAPMESGKVWYRFRVGKFNDRDAAAAMRDRLVAEGSRDAYILQDK